MISINFKVIGLTQPRFGNARYEFESMTLGFLHLPERETDALLIRLPRLVCSVGVICWVPPVVCMVWWKYHICCQSADLSSLLHIHSRYWCNYQTVVAAQKEYSAKLIKNVNRAYRVHLKTKSSFHFRYTSMSGTFSFKISTKAPIFTFEQLWCIWPIYGRNREMVWTI